MTMTGENDDDDVDDDYPPPPLRSSPLSQGDSQLLLANAITHFLPLRQGAKGDSQYSVGTSRL